MSERFEFTERQILCNILSHYKGQVNRYQDMFRDTEVPKTILHRVQEYKAIVRYVENRLGELNGDLG